MAWFASVSSERLFLSVLSLGEIRRGVELLRMRDLQRAALLEEWLSGLERDFQERILPVTSEIADLWGRMGIPDPVPVVDGLIAATARAHGLTVVTRNVADFERTGAPVLNPFSG